MATPIGNLGDISTRAIAILRHVDRLLAEDTRRTRKLLAHVGVRRRLEPYHEHNERARTPIVLGRLAAGESVALVTDAGTPGVSDPGFRLVRACIDAGRRVVPIPGPSAPIAALVASGLPTDCFFFAGYPPRKAGERRRFLERLQTVPGTLIFLESPRRLTRTLESIAETLGDARRAAVARELTKAHEEFMRGRVADILERLRDQEIRGEVTLCVGPGETRTPELALADLPARYRELLGQGLERREATRLLARETSLGRREVYRLLLELPNDGEDDR